MLEVHYDASDGSTRAVEAAEGESVMKVAIDNDVPGIVGECGGACACATCHVYVDPRFAELVGPVSDLEDDMLEGTASPRRESSRLSCQLRMSALLDGIRVEVPEEQL